MIDPKRELAAVRDWKMIGISLATAAGAVEAKILAENPQLALRSQPKPIVEGEEK